MNHEFPSSISRRRMLTGTAAIAGVGALLQRANAADKDEAAGHAGHGGHGEHGGGAAGASASQAAMKPVVSTGKTEIFSPPGISYRPVITPNGQTLPWKIVDGVKVFHLVAEPVT